MMMMMMIPLQELLQFPVLETPQELQYVVDRLLQWLDLEHHTEGKLYLGKRNKVRALSPEVATDRNIHGSIER